MLCILRCCGWQIYKCSKLKNKKNVYMCWQNSYWLTKRSVSLSPIYTTQWQCWKWQRQRQAGRQRERERYSLPQRLKLQRLNVRCLFHIIYCGKYFVLIESGEDGEYVFTMSAERKKHNAKNNTNKSIIPIQYILTSTLTRISANWHVPINTARGSNKTDHLTSCWL